MSSSDQLARKSSFSDHQRAERRASPELAAYHWSGVSQRQSSIRDISSTGLYLLTEERWSPGALVTLTLQREGLPANTPDRCFAVKTRAVRWGEDGVGLSFVLPAGMNLRLWKSGLKSVDDLPEPEAIVTEFRVAEALAFLGRISPAGAEEARQLLREGLSNYRLASAVEIALKAEKLLEPAPDADKLRAHPRLVARILEDGSWVDDDSIQQLWAGLLATSCTVNGKDESNLTFVDLLSQLTPIHIRIFVAACTRAKKYVSGLGPVTSRPLACTAQEMIQMTGARDLIRIDRDLEHLSDLGLIAKRVESSFFTPIDNAIITPTSLGLQLYARCSGHRGASQDFYDVVPAGDSAMPV